MRQPDPGSICAPIAMTPPNRRVRVVPSSERTLSVTSADAGSWKVDWNTRAARVVS